MVLVHRRLGAVISLNNDDVAFQDGGNSYVHGYSAGEQKRWLQAELAEARRDSDIDWVVVCMHQTAISTADRHNGADLGIRQEWLPLFDQYRVDLVVCGHEHHYERSHPLRGAMATDVRTPIPVDTRTESSIQPGEQCTSSSVAAVHRCQQRGSFPATSVPRVDRRRRIRSRDGCKAPIYVMEDAPWSAFRDRDNPYGFVLSTSTRVTGRQHLDQGHALRRTGPFGAIARSEFTLTKPRGG